VKGISTLRVIGENLGARFLAKSGALGQRALPVRKGCALAERALPDFVTKHLVTLRAHPFTV